MMKAEATKAEIIKDLNRRIFEKFSEKYAEQRFKFSFLNALILDKTIGNK